MQIQENMLWPPSENSYLYNKMKEYAAWYSNDIDSLSQFYSQIQNSVFNQNMFWARQLSSAKSKIVAHVPLASDIAELSSNLLFGESPLFTISELKQNYETYKNDAQELQQMINETNLSRKLAEAAETCAAIGGVFIKLAIDSELSEYPIPVVVQADYAIPEFKFGKLTKVIFWQDVMVENEKVYRLLEHYEKGRIRYELCEGTADRLGKKVSLQKIEQTKSLPEIITFTVNELFAVYIPNKLPNKLNRNSYLGASDYCGLETLFDKLDEVFTSWAKEVTLAQPKILLPEVFLKRNVETGGFEYDYDQSLFVKLDIDPTSTSDLKITPQQFEIRAEQFEKTALMLIERIITSAGYSPQSFGLNIQGRAESGTALNVRERKSLITKAKKQQYWKPEIERLLKLMILLYRYELGGKINSDITPNIEFSDSITNNPIDVAQTIKLLNDAICASIETKVKLLHPEWTEEQIQSEVAKIKEENNLGQPLDNPDLSQLNFNNEDDVTNDLDQNV